MRSAPPSRTGRVVAVVALAGEDPADNPVEAALRDLDGMPLATHAVLAAAAAVEMSAVLVVVPRGSARAARRILDGSMPRMVEVIEAGPTRRSAIRAAVAHLRADVDVVVVHDPLRPLAPTSLVDTVVAAVRGGADVAVPALPVTDTLKLVATDGALDTTLDRLAFRSISTPYAYHRSVLEELCGAAQRSSGRRARSGLLADVLAARAAGFDVVEVLGTEEAMRVDSTEHLPLLDAMLAWRRLRGRAAARRG